MTQPETPDRLTNDSAQNAQSSAAAETSPPEDARPEPEPWTGERASEWNNYYDLYVTLGVLLLVFVVSANKITQSSIWTQLQVGRMIAAKNAPVLTDVFSYTRQGAPWVNVPWLFEWGQALVHKTAYNLTPGDTTDRTTWEGRADQVAAGTLVALNALVRVFTALVLLSIRRAGPGRWWSAVCVMLALGAIFGPGNPAIVFIGGIAKPALVGPATWGLLFFALEVWLLHRAHDLGRRSAAFTLIPLFVLWANVDESFLIGLFVLAAFAIGQVWTPRRPGNKVTEPTGLGLPTALGVLIASIAACVVNPSHVAVFKAGADSLLGLFRPSTDVLTPERLSLFSSAFWKQVGPGYLAYFLVVVGLGYASFALNRRRFSLSRFLMYSVGVILWGALLRYSPEFSVLFAATLALNGQEWYHDTYGTAGRIGSGWSVWSVGGRAITILAIFVCVAKVLLGGLPVDALAASDLDPQFGFGYDRDDFAFEAADFLKAADFQGNVLNSFKAEGDALILRAYPTRKVYMDNRPHLYPPDLFNRLQDTRKALSEDVVKDWKPLLDEYKITAVMVPAIAARTYQVLRQSKNWVPFYDDGAVSMFGRVDAPEPDLAFFQANRLDPDILAYAKEKRTPASDRPPTPVTWMDIVFQYKRLAHPQPHDEAAQHWLTLPGDARVAGLPDPARALLAVREAPTALASKPDDNTAFRLLALAYRTLLIQETALLAGLKLTPENSAQISQISPRASVLPTRFRQLITSLNYAIQTTPPPKTLEERRELRRLNVELFQLFLSANFLDLARDRLQAVYDQSPVDKSFSAEDRALISRDLADLKERIKQIEEQMTTLTTEQPLSPFQLANYATNQGAPGLAIHELEEAEKTGTNPAQVKPLLLDLYCDTGQPEKAVEMLSSGTIDDPSFGVEAGVSPMRQGRVYYLLGNSDYTGTLWENYAIPRLRFERATRAIGSAVSFLRGDVRVAVGEDLQIPANINRQADWEFEAGLCFLEGGSPKKSAEHFTKALTLAPKLSTRPIIAYYLEKLGKAVPPIPEPATLTDEKLKAKAEKDDAKPADGSDKPKTDEPRKTDTESSK